MLACNYHYDLNPNDPVSKFMFHYINAANEVVVASFLKDDISFLGMSDVIEKTMERVAFIANPTYDDYVATDAEARKIAASLI